MLTLCRRVLRFALASLVFGSYVTGSATAGTDCSSVRAQRGAMPSDVGLDATLRSDVADVNGTTLHYVWGGNGPAVVLLHGYPQDWTEWRHVIPELSRHFTVVAVDLRGIGGSKPTQGGYDAMNLAADIRGLVRKLELDRPYIAGHDIGGLVAYAYGRAYPDATRGVMVLDVPLPGVAPWSEVNREPTLWHFHFHQTPDLPEALVGGREAVYFRDFVNRMGGDPSLFSEADIARFAAAYGTACALRAGFEFYRAFPLIADWNEKHTTPTDTPIVLAAGERATARLLPAAAADLRRKGARNVATEIIADSGHYVADDEPDRVVELVSKYAGR
jgi:pimeloyl-ACP methyl ester carboxylesterase